MNSIWKVNPAGVSPLRLWAGLLAAMVVGLLSALLPGLLSVSAAIEAAVGFLFLLLLVHDLEWAYLLFVLVICLLPSRFNQEILNLDFVYLNFYDPLLLALFLVWIFDVFSHKRAFYASRHFIWLLSFLALVLASALFSSNTYSSPMKMEAGLVDWLRFGMFFIMTYHLLQESKDVSKFFYVLAAGSFMVAAYGIYDYFFVKSAYSFAGQAVQSFSYEKRNIVGSLIGGGATTLAGFLSLTMPLVFTHWLFVKNRFQKLLFLGVLITQAVMLVLTFSRGGWLSISVIIFITILMTNRKPMRIVAGLLFFVLFLGTAWTLLPKSVHDRLATVTQPKNDVNVERVFFWNQAAGYIRHSPLIGSGPDNKYNTSIPYSTVAHVPIWHCHNWILYTGVETGLLGIGLLFGYLLGLLARAFIRLRKQKLGAIPGYQYGAWAGIAGFMFHNQVDYFLWQPRMSIIFWMMVLLLAHGVAGTPGQQTPSA